MVSSGPGLPDLVPQDLGVAIVPAPIAAKQAGRLAAVPLTPELPDRTMVVAVPLQPSPAARSLLAQLEAPAAR